MWVEECLQHTCEVVVSAAKTSYSLQSADQTSNKRFNESLRAIKDMFMNQMSVDTNKVNFNNACALYACECLTANGIRSSVEVTRVYPFNRDFAEQFETTRDVTLDKAQAAVSSLNHASISSRLVSLRDGHNDNDTKWQVLPRCHTHYAQQLLCRTQVAKPANSLRRTNEPTRDTRECCHE